MPRKNARPAARKRLEARDEKVEAYRAGKTRRRAWGVPPPSIGLFDPGLAGLALMTLASRSVRTR